MIKKQQKWIALLVICTFAWLLHASAMPLNAAASANEIDAANSEKATGSIETVAEKAAPAKKKSMLPLVLIGVGALAVAAVVLFVWPGILTDKYDVTGSWVFVFTGPYPEPPHQTDFTGTKESGSWIWSHVPTTKGTYTVDGKNLTMVPGAGDGWTATITGTFTSKDAMSGTWIQSGTTWNWTATRGTSPTHIVAPTIQALGSVN